MKAGFRRFGYGKVKRIKNRGYVTHYTIKLTLRDQDYYYSNMITEEIKMDGGSRREVFVASKMGIFNTSAE